MESEVYELATSFCEYWPRIVKLMCMFAERENTIVEGSTRVTNLDQACKMKRVAIFAILECICTLIK